MSEFKPVETVADLEMLDPEEIRDGYWSGWDGDPEPGNNRSRAFWHGWRNGARDKGRIPQDDAMTRLVHEVVSTGYLRGMIRQ